MLQAVWIFHCMITDRNRTRVLEEQNTCTVAMYQTGCLLITKKEHSKYVHNEKMQWMCYKQMVWVCAPKQSSLVLCTWFEAQVWNRTISNVPTPKCFLYSWFKENVHLMETVENNDFGYFFSVIKGKKELRILLRLKKVKGLHT